MNRKSNEISTYIMATWRHWTFSLGLVCVLVVLSPWVSRHFFPYMTLGFSALLGMLIYNRRNRVNQGLAVPFIVCATLLFEGLLLMGFNLTVRITDIYELAGKPVNDELPFIVQLTLSPIMAVVSGLFLLRKLGRGRFFRTRIGSSDVSLIQRMVWQESRYQTRMLFIINVVLSVAEWYYTYFSFTSISINKPDMFFFVWLPVIVFVLSLIYLGFRCISLWAFYIQNDPGNMVSPHRSTILRYLIVADDNLYVKTLQLDVKQGMESYIDTPVRVRTHYSDNVTVGEAKDMFERYTGIASGFIKTLKYLFVGIGHGSDSNIMHFLCVLNDAAAVDDSRIAGGKWMSLYELRHLNLKHRLSAEMSSELVHIYTVAMAWKSYDYHGNRRYPIKHYQPTYRLCDIYKWDVDYDDEHWLKVARLNADSPFFKLRRFFTRIISPSVQ
ncbi:MAG: hypothetical protein K2K86_06115 [Muribaculaceae bacterium]|nr:hypothetical protein [Muribaculaceae bacterium]